MEFSKLAAVVDIPAGSGGKRAELRALRCATQQLESHEQEGDPRG